MCLQAGYTAQALSLAKATGNHAFVIRLMLESGTDTDSKAVSLPASSPSAADTERQSFSSSSSSLAASVNASDEEMNFTDLGEKSSFDWSTIDNPYSNTHKTANTDETAFFSTNMQNNHTHTHEAEEDDSAALLSTFQSYSYASSVPLVTKQKKPKRTLSVLPRDTPVDSSASAAQHTDKNALLSTGTENILDGLSSAPRTRYSAAIAYLSKIPAEAATIEALFRSGKILMDNHPRATTQLIMSAITHLEESEHAQQDTLAEGTDGDYAGDTGATALYRTDSLSTKHLVDRFIPLFNDHPAHLLHFLEWILNRNPEQTSFIYETLIDCYLRPAVCFFLFITCV